jgi:nitrite reductase (NADH) large subunit
MKVVIIGNGVAGIFSAQHIRSLDKDLQIEIYSQESYPYYTRIKLPELISEKVIIDDIIVFKEDWYQNKKIKTYLNKKV